MLHELPKARTEGVITETVDDEIVVYDLDSQVAHSLTAVAASVWERCDGHASPAEIANGLGLPAAAVQQALDELQGCNLLDDGPELGEGYSRRQAVTKIAKVGGAAFTAPLIYSVVVGSAAAAASCLANGQPDPSCVAGPGAKAGSTRCCSASATTPPVKPRCVSRQTACRERNLSPRNHPVLFRPWPLYRHHYSHLQQLNCRPRGCCCVCRSRA